MAYFRKTRIDLSQDQERKLIMHVLLTHCFDENMEGESTIREV